MDDVVIRAIRQPFLKEHAIMVVNKQRYDPTTMALHWATAILVVMLWVIGQTADWFPRGPLKNDYWSIHVVLGFGLTVVLISRIVWRAGPGRRLPAADEGMLHLVAKATHYALYLLLLTVLALGVVNAFVRGYGIFGLFYLPQLGDREWRGAITNWHGLAANALLVVALVHASAALVHHYLWRDGLLDRMMPNTSAHKSPVYSKGRTPLA